MVKITQIATALATVVGGVNQITGQQHVTVIKSVVAVDESGRCWELDPDPLRATWKRLPDLPDDLPKMERESVLRTN